MVLDRRGLHSHVADSLGFESGHHDIFRAQKHTRIIEWVDRLILHFSIDHDCVDPVEEDGHGQEIPVRDLEHHPRGIFGGETMFHDTSDIAHLGQVRVFTRELCSIDGITAETDVYGDGGEREQQDERPSLATAG